MRGPSLLSQCLPGLLPQDRGSQSISSVSERDAHFSTPTVEILPSKVVSSKYDADTIDSQGPHVFKGKISVVNIVGFIGLEMICTKNDGALKSWDSSIDLVNVLKHEIRDGQLSFRGKRVLEVGTRNCIKGVKVVTAAHRGISSRKKRENGTAPQAYSPKTETRGAGLNPSRWRRSGESLLILRSVPSSGIP